MAVAGSLGGTPSAPAKECIGGNCTVDFGDYILEGIPENYSEYVEANGNSGGTDKLASLAAMLAQQLEDEGLPAEGGLVQEFSDLLDFMGQIQGKVEANAQMCLTNATPDCFKNSMGSTLMPLPESLKNVLTNYDPNVSLLKTDYEEPYEYVQTVHPITGQPMAPTVVQAGDTYSIDMDNSLLGTINNIKMSLDQGNSLTNADRLPQNALVQKYIQIAESPDIPEHVKDLISDMFVTESSLTTDCFGKSQYLTSDKDLHNLPGYDPINYDTGDVLLKMKDFENTGLVDIVKPRGEVPFVLEQ